ncbi:hypothetical protein BaRGS_00002483, partial [Batillaria attramentaria]
LCSRGRLQNICSVAQTCLGLNVSMLAGASGVLNAIMPGCNCLQNKNKLRPNVVKADAREKRGSARKISIIRDKAAVPDRLVPRLCYLFSPSPGAGRRSLAAGSGGFRETSSCNGDCPRWARGGWGVIIASRTTPRVHYYGVGEYCRPKIIQSQIGDCF